MKPRVSIITVNYNGLGLTCALIDSLHGHCPFPLEIIVIDNGSTQNEAETLEATYPDIKVVRSEENLGFAGGNNLGIDVATGEYLYFLNNDTEVTDDTLNLLVERLDNDPSLGVVCPKIRFYAPPQAIQFAGYTPLSRITLRNRLIGFQEVDKGGFDTPHESPYAHGAAMMVRREAIERAGKMPECYFLYYEELDWSVRIREAGYKIAYEPRATVFHKESATTGQESPLRSYYLTRNRLLFARRNRHGIIRLLSLLYQLGIALPKNLLATQLHNRPDLTKADWQGALDFIRHRTGKKW